MSGGFAGMAGVMGRVLLGGVFVFGALEHVGVRRDLVKFMRLRGVPMPLVVLAIGSIFQGVCGLLLMLGQLVQAACGGLVIFTIAATIMFLNFWDMEGAERAHARNAAVVNVGIIGGLFIAASQAVS